MHLTERRNAWRQGRHSIRRAFSSKQRKPKDSSAVRQFQLQSFPWEDGKLEHGGCVEVNINTWIADFCIVAQHPDDAPSTPSRSSLSTMAGEEIELSVVDSSSESLEKTESTQVTLSNWSENPQREWQRIVDACFSGWGQGSPLFTGILQHRPSRFVEAFSEDVCKTRFGHRFEQRGIKQHQQRRLRQQQKAEPPATHKVIRLI